MSNDTIQPLTSEQAAFVEKHLALVYFVLQPYQHLPEQTKEDLQSRLYLRLCQCATNYKPELGFQPSTYLVKSLRGEIGKHFRDETWVVRPPRAIREKVFVEQLPETSDLAHSEDTSNVDTISVKEKGSLQSCVLPVSLDEPMTEDGDSRLEMLPDDTDVEEEVVNDVGGRQILRIVFQALTLEERYTLALQMRSRPISDLEAKFEISRPTAALIWDELRAKVERYYLAALQGDSLPPSEGNTVLKRILKQRFQAQRISFLELRTKGYPLETK